MRVKLHPATKFILAICYVLTVFYLPFTYQIFFLLLGWLIIWIFLKPSSSQDPGKIFLRLLITAGIFLSIIHCISIEQGFVFNPEGLYVAGNRFFRIGALMAAFLFLIRSISSEELFSFLIDLKMNLSMIYVVFKSIFLIPRFRERTKEILIAQQARGFVLKGIKSRLKAISLILYPLFSSIMFELEESAASIYTRGLHLSQRKTHLTKNKFVIIDLVAIALSFFVLIATLILVSW